MDDVIGAASLAEFVEDGEVRPRLGEVLAEGPIRVVDDLDWAVEVSRRVFQAARRLGDGDGLAELPRGADAALLRMQKLHAERGPPERDAAIEELAAEAFMQVAQGEVGIVGEPKS